MNSWTAQEIRAIFRYIADCMVENKDLLIKLDGETGDGDLGLTMSLGFSKAAEQVANAAETDIGRLFVLAGSALAQAAPSTMGTLMGSGLMKGGKALQGKTQITLSDLAAFFQAMVEAIAARGKSKRGEKTVIDSLAPAADALVNAVENQQTLSDGLRLAYAAACSGLEATKTMLPQHGRAVYYQETARGKQDPGATVGMLLVKSFAEIA